MRQIYKNLYYDEQVRQYCFVSGGERRYVATQEGYLLTYILEVLLNGRD